jgi:hypothetical protein
MRDAAHPTARAMRRYGRLLLWDTLPNGKHADFFNLRAGHRAIERFRADLHADLTTLFDMLGCWSPPSTAATRSPKPPQPRAAPKRVACPAR